MSNFQNEIGKVLSKIENKDWESHWEVHKYDINQLILDYFIYEGLHIQAETFARENNMNYTPDPFMIERCTLRELFHKGEIDLAIQKLLSIWNNFVDENIYFYYFLMEHKAIEMIGASKEDAVDEITEFIRDEIGDIVLLNKELVPYLEDLMEYFIFRNFDINERRCEIANYVNKCLMESRNMKCVLKGYVEEMVNGEKSLGKSYIFPTFEHYFK